MIESTRLCPRCLQTLRMSNDASGLFYLCDACGWGTHDESLPPSTHAVSPADLPRYIRSSIDELDERPRASGE